MVSDWLLWDSSGQQEKIWCWFMSAILTSVLHEESWLYFENNSSAKSDVNSCSQFGDEDCSFMYKGMCFPFHFFPISSKIICLLMLTTRR